MNLKTYELKNLKTISNSRICDRSFVRSFFRSSVLWFFSILSFIILSVPAQAANKAEAEEKYLTKEEAIRMLTATDFVKKKMNELVSWTVGYDVSKVSQVKLTPSINFVKAIPKKVPPDDRTIFSLLASVDDPNGLENIAGVRADLSPVGRLPDTALVDSGRFGDEKEGDGIYSLQNSVAEKVRLGQKEIPVSVSNKKGWLALAKTNLDIRKNPAIIETKIAPEPVLADGKSPATLSVTIDNPGWIKDIEEATADLQIFGYRELLMLRNDGKAGDVVAGDDIFTLQFVVPEFIDAGEYEIGIGARNLAGGAAFKTAKIRVYK